MTRMTPGTTVTEAITGLTTEQKKALKALSSARSAEQKATAALDEHAATLKTQVASALGLGVPARVIADTLGITRTRVYQMKDEAVTP